MTGPATLLIVDSPKDKQEMFYRIDGCEPLVLFVIIIDKFDSKLPLIVFKHKILYKPLINTNLEEQDKADQLIITI